MGSLSCCTEACVNLRIYDEAPSAIVVFVHCDWVIGRDLECDGTICDPYCGEDGAESRVVEVLGVGNLLTVVFVLLPSPRDNDVVDPLAVQGLSAI